MEKWQELINYMNMTAEWLQVIIAGFALYTGLNYLEDHRKKIKEERKIQLIMELKKDLYLLRKLATRFYKKPKGLWYDYELELDGNFEIMKKFVQDLTNRLANEEPLDMAMLRAEITSKLELYGDPDFIKLYTIFETSFGFFNKKYLNLNHYLNEESVNHELCKNNFLEIPFDFRSVKHAELKTSESAFLNLQRFLTNEYHKK